MAQALIIEKSSGPAYPNRGMESTESPSTLLPTCQPGLQAQSPRPYHVHLSKSSCPSSHKESTESPPTPLPTCQPGSLHQSPLQDHVHLSKPPCPSSPKEFQPESQLAQNHAAKSPNIPPTCQVCAKTLKNTESLRAHMRYTHINSYKCAFCYVHFKLKSILKAHMVKKHLASKSLLFMYCDFCRKVFVSKKNMLRHIIYVHLAKIKCSVCSRKFVYKSSLRIHAKQQHSGLNINLTQIKKSKSLTCNACERTFKESKALKNHVLRVHHRTYKCLVCYSLLKDRARFLVHCSNHGNIAVTGRYVQNKVLKAKTCKVFCPLCKLKLDTQVGLIKHVQQAHGCEMHCPACENVSFRDVSDLQEHICTVHGKLGWLTYFSALGNEVTQKVICTQPVEGKFACFLCQEKFGSRDELRNHVFGKHVKRSLQYYIPKVRPKRRSKTMSKKTKLCKKNSVSKSSKSMDISVLKTLEVSQQGSLVTSIPSNQTSQVKKKTSDPQVDSIVSGDVTSFSCALCQFSHSHLDAVESHWYRAHGRSEVRFQTRVSSTGGSGTSSHPCMYCQALFGSASVLQNHMKSAHPGAHVSSTGGSGASSHPCKYCQALFGSASVLQKHVKWDHRGTLYCFKCTYSCVDPYIMSCHMSVMHHVQPATQILDPNRGVKDQTSRKNLKLTLNTPEPAETCVTSEISTTSSAIPLMQPTVVVQVPKSPQRPREHLVLPNRANPLKKPSKPPSLAPISSCIQPSNLSVPSPTSILHTGTLDLDNLVNVDRISAITPTSNLFTSSEASSLKSSIKQEHCSIDLIEVKPEMFEEMEVPMETNKETDFVHDHALMVQTPPGMKHIIPQVKIEANEDPGFARSHDFLVTSVLRNPSIEHVDVKLEPLLSLTDPLLRVDQLDNLAQIEHINISDVKPDTRMEIDPLVPNLSDPLLNNYDPETKNSPMFEHVDVFRVKLEQPEFDTLSGPS